MRQGVRISRKKFMHNKRSDSLIFLIRIIGTSISNMESFRSRFAFHSLSMINISAKTYRNSRAYANENYADK